MKIQSPVNFFFIHAGYSYPSSANKRQQRQARMDGARRLAAAEELSRVQGWSARWSVDPGSDSSSFTDEAPVWSLWQALLVDDKGKALGSLGGIDFGRDGEPWGDSYRRVVEAELAIEAATEAGLRFYLNRWIRRA